MLQITKFRRTGKLSKKWCQKSFKMGPKSSFGYPGVRILRLGGGCDRGPIFDMFLSGPKIETNIEKWGGGVKRTIPRQGSAAEVGSSKSFWNLQIDKICQSLQKHFRRPVPCEQGGGRFKGYRLCRRSLWERVLVDVVSSVSIANIVSTVGR